jgi:hypothetical protein
MKRRDFLIKSASAAGVVVPAAFATAQTKPCAPPTLSVQGGTSASTTCASSVDAEADWQSRISGPGVVWYHDFRSDAEVNAFRWTNGYKGGNDPLSKGSGATNVRRITTDGITGGGCMEIQHPAGGQDGMHWWRPFSPFAAPGNGRTTNDPAAGGTLPLRTWNATDGGLQTAQYGDGFYTHPSYGANDGSEFWLQMRVKRDPRRFTGANQGAQDIGKFIYITVCQISLSDQEIVTYSGSQAFRMYGGWQVFAALDQAPGADGSLQPGGVAPLWQWAIDGTWDTVMYHFKPGRQGVNETLLEVYGAHHGQTSFTLFWQQTIAIGSWDPGDGWQALICTTYNNGTNFPSAFFERWTQLIFSKQTIPCPQV